MENPVQDFSVGFSAGISLIAIELELFAADLFAQATSKILSSTPQTTVPIPDLSLILLGVVVAECIQHFLTGFFGSDAFAIGFLIGDAFVILTLGSVLASAMPGVLVGLILGFFSTLAGLYLKHKN